MRIHRQLLSLRTYLLILTLSFFARSDEQKVLQNSGTNHDEPDLDLAPQFESPEHAAIGDSVRLRYRDSTIQGDGFQYEVNNTLLSFGDIIALSGDFYYGVNAGACAPAISNSWDKDRGASLEVASKYVNLLRTDEPGILGCVRDVIAKQDRDVRDAQKLGKDPAQARTSHFSAYRAIEDKCNGQYALCSPLGYAVIALCNWDHFGEDAVKAYSAVHTLALNKALEASRSQKQSDLKEAYFIDAYGQHFLTDMFSAGHIRTPRRLLHSNLFPKWSPADRSNKLQHDEDCANGLWVTNREGESWTAYGDKHYSQGRSAKNRQMVHAAIQTSVDEIWETFNSGTTPPPDQFKALHKIPQPDRAVGFNNFVPLFQLKADDPSLMLYRANVDQRAVSSSRKTMSAKLSNDEWDVLRQQVADSGSIKNMYVFTKSFVSDQQILHFGLTDLESSTMPLNSYGTVDAGTYGKNWGMASQGALSMAGSPLKKTWTDVRSLDGTTFSLVGRLGGLQTKNRAIHMGVQISKASGGQMGAKLVWNDTVDDGNGALTPGQVLYGSFSNGSGATSMVKFFDGDKRNAKIELWSVSADLQSPPAKIGSDIKVARLNFMISHKISPTDTFSTVVAYARGNPVKPEGYWYFCSWQSDYKEQKLTTIPESNAKSAQALLSDPTSGRIFRILYGKSFAEPATIQIDVLRPVRNVTTGAIEFDAKTDSRKFSITWEALVEQNYLLWFVHDVNGDGHQDLVAYTSDQSNIYLNVVVFPSKADGTIADPVVSPIKLDDGIGTLLTAEFMQPLYTTQATYTNEISGKKTTGAIMSFFDNYGIVGTRVMAPDSSKGSFKYVFAGQDSSIGGQRSTTIAQRPQDWMGLRRTTEAIGIVPV